MKRRRLIIKFTLVFVGIAVGVWLYLTEFQKFRVRRILDQAHEELASGRMDVHRIVSLDSALSRIFDGGKTLPSVKKYAESHLKSYRSGDPMKFAACVMIGHPNLKWANGIGRSITVPLSVMLIEDAGGLPPKTRAYVEEIACTLLPKATGQSFGISGLTFVDSEPERTTAIGQWHDWYQINKFALLERDQRVNKAVEAQIGQQKEFVEGILNLNR